MRILGFDACAKFSSVLSTEEDTTNFKHFAKTLREMQGLVIFHGILDGRWPAHYGDPLHDLLLPAAQEGRCAVIVIDTIVNTQPENTHSAYLHFYSVGVPTPAREDQEIAFRLLAKHFRLASAIPNEAEMRKIWSQVDPSADRLPLLRALEEVLWSERPGEDVLSEEMGEKLRPIYGNALCTFSQLRKEYLSLMEEGRLRQSANRWHARRDTISHQLFHHGFFALLDRLPVRTALEDPNQTFPEKLVPVLQYWFTIQDQLTELLDSANPFAIATGEMSLACLQPRLPKSIAIFEHYKNIFAEQVESAITPIRRTAFEMNEEVIRLIAESKTSSARSRKPSNILELCQKLSVDFSSLKSLEALGERDA